MSLSTSALLNWTAFAVKQWTPVHHFSSTKPHTAEFAFGWVNNSWCNEHFHENSAKWRKISWEKKTDSKKTCTSAFYVFPASVGQLEAVPILHFTVNLNLCTCDCIMNHCVCFRIILSLIICLCSVEMICLYEYNKTFVILIKLWLATKMCWMQCVHLNHTLMEDHLLPHNRVLVNF